MHLNAHTALSTPSLLLVPYSSHHVPTYHAWMQSPALQQATASEPLTLEQEHAMQRSWRADRDKLTFIVCLPFPSSSSSSSSWPGGQEQRVAGNAKPTMVITKGTSDAADRMLGDVNLFLTGAELDDADDAEDGNAHGGDIVGEVELMIAAPELQGKGYGRRALLTFLVYVLAHWSAIATEYSPSPSPSPSAHGGALAFLRARIHESNERSIALFESVGFKRTAAGANYFGELELRWREDVEFLMGLRGWEEVTEVWYD